MTKTLVACSPASDLAEFRHDLYPHDRDRAARSRRRRERAETRQEADQGLRERQDEELHQEAIQCLVAVVEKWVEIGIDLHNEDRASWEFGQVLRAAGYNKPARDRLKEALIGPKCPSCLSRLCEHTPIECADRLYEAELADWQYDWDCDTR